MKACRLLLVVCREIHLRVFSLEHLGNLLHHVCHQYIRESLVVTLTGSDLLGIIEIPCNRIQICCDTKLQEKSQEPLYGQAFTVSVALKQRNVVLPASVTDIHVDREWAINHFSRELRLTPNFSHLEKICIERLLQSIPAHPPEVIKRNSCSIKPSQVRQKDLSFLYLNLCVVNGVQCVLDVQEDVEVVQHKIFVHSLVSDRKHPFELLLVLTLKAGKSNILDRLDKKLHTVPRKRARVTPEAVDRPSRFLCLSNHVVLILDENTAVTNHVALDGVEHARWQGVRGEGKPCKVAQPL
mmetsp:Transcript_14452/g.33228  ORF Transcript_14452/g.33228 Transcript_14452/m.33228 type:complete len:297 (+) Transcript_14452:1441-2331(+)